MKVFKKGTSQKNSIFFSIALAGTLLSSPLAAHATVIDWTNQNLNQIDAYNTATGTNSVVDAKAYTPDSLIFTGNGNIIYGSNVTTAIGTVPPGYNLMLYNTATKTNSVLASGASLGGSTALRDLALTPGGNSVLVSSYSGGEVYKVNISTGAVSTFTTTSGHPQGLVFTSGNLFLNLGAGIEQLNPTTGSPIISNNSITGLDGLTYDPTTGMLYATSSVTGSNANNTIVQINPKTLSETLLTVAGSGISSSLNLDGIEATANGNLIIANYSASGGGQMLEYYTKTNTASLLESAAGIDDVAPLVGGGSLANTPEPTTFALFGTGILVMMMMAARSRRKAESC